MTDTERTSLKIFTDIDALTIRVDGLAMLVGFAGDGIGSDECDALNAADQAIRSEMDKLRELLREARRLAERGEATD